MKRIYLCAIVAVLAMSFGTLVAVATEGMVSHVPEPKTPVPTTDDSPALTHSIAKSESFKSELLLHDAKGNPKTVEYRVLLPKHYDPKKKYPVVLFLHGLGDNMKMAERLGALSEMDRIVNQKKQPFIMVCPNGGVSYWMDGAKSGQRWEDVVSQELIQDFEKRYPAALREKSGWLIAGISMGGSSAVRIALDHPDLFIAIGAHSPIFRDQKWADQDFETTFGEGAAFQIRDPFWLMQSGRKLPGALRIDAGDADSTDRRGRARLFAAQFFVPTCAQHFDDVNGTHSDSYWKKHFHEYMNWYSNQLSGNHTPCD